MDKRTVRVMIISEIDEYIELLTKLLELERYQVLVLPNKLRFLELIRDIKPNVIFVCRYVNCIEICDTIKKTNIFSEIPIILMHGDDERFESRFDAGLNDFRSHLRIITWLH
jgi:CheY-like chemotaxis protein